MKLLCSVILAFLLFHHLPVRSSDTIIVHSGKIKKKVLLIGIDGLQYEKMLALPTPNFDRFNIVKGYAGGIVGTTSQQTTGSGPGWITILTGVWSDQNGVISNDTANKVQSKSLFQYLKERNQNFRTTSIATWSAIHDFLDTQMQFVDTRYDGGTDKEATNKVVKELETGDADLTFVQFSDPDVIGHYHGYGEKYDQSILSMDKYLGEIMKSVNERAKAKKEEWLVILTTDHGRRGDGHNHGSQTTEEKTVFIGMNVQGNKNFYSINQSVPNKDFNGIYGYPPQTSILPTILTYLDIKINSDWQLASPPLIGREGPSNVMINPNDSTLHWNTSTTGEARIYKDKMLLAKVPAKTGQYLIEKQLDSVPHCYTVMINEQSGSVIQNNRRVKAAINLDNNKRGLLLFNDDSYSLYDKEKKVKEHGSLKTFPKDIIGINSEYLAQLRGAMRWDKSTICLFLTGGRYMLYNTKENSIVDGYPKDINNTTWPGLEAYARDIISAVRLNNEQVCFFIGYGMVKVFNIVENKTETEFAQPINEKTLPGLSAYAPKIIVALDFSEQFCYIFLKDNSLIKYDKINLNIVNPRPIPFSEINWFE